MAATDEKTKDAIKDIHAILQELPLESSVYVLRRLSNVYFKVYTTTLGNKESIKLDISSDENEVFMEIGGKRISVNDYLNEMYGEDAVRQLNEADQILKTERQKLLASQLTPILFNQMAGDAIVVLKHLLAKAEIRG